MTDALTPRCTVVPVPAAGAEDVAGHRRRPGLHRHRGRQHLPGAPRRRRSTGSADTGGRPLGLELLPDGRLLVCDAAPRAARASTRRRRDRAAGTRSTARRCGSATTPRSRPTATSGSPTPAGLYVDRALEERLRRGHPHRPAAGPPAPRHGRGGARGAGLRQRRRAGGRRVLRGGRRDRRAHRRPALAGRAAGRPARLAGRGPAGLPRQHRPRQRRADLGDHRLARPTRWSERLQRGAAGAAQAGDPDPRAAAAGAEAHGAGAGVRRRRHASCTTSTPTPLRSTWSPACGSTTAGSGWAACTSRRSPCSTVTATVDRSLPGRRPARDGGADHGSAGAISTGRADLRALDRPTSSTELASEIRDFLVSKVARTGGHLGPNLGVVELTMAIHRVFDSPRDPVVFDTGHQSYVHKMLTGRAAGFDRLRQEGGLSGYPSRAESEHDMVENPHASTVAVLRRRAGQGLRHPRRGPARRGGDRRRRAHRRHGVGGAQQHRRSGKDRPLVIVVNDNGRSYTPTVGGLADRAHRAAHQPALRAGARRRQEAAQRRSAASARRSTTRCTR